MPHAIRFVLVLALMLCLPAGARAQQRPLVTEDPEVIGAGRMLIEGGLDYGRDVEYPASGLEGTLFRAPLLGISVGLSSIAELQIDGGFHNRLSITDRADAPLAALVTATGESTRDVEDVVIATKIRIVAEGATRPAFAVRFATKLPNASNESGLGLDTTDFMLTVLGAKTVQSVRVVANAGLGILADPTAGNQQNDVLLYGLSFARALTTRAEVIGEVNGRLDVRNGDPYPGTESRGVARFGARYTIGSWRADGAILFGLTGRDPAIGFGAGFTYVFQAFQLP